MSINNVTNAIPGLISGLRGSTANFGGIANAARQYQEMARQVAAREFMYQLRGDNDIIELETNNGEVGKEATELAKGA